MKKSYKLIGSIPISTISVLAEKTEHPRDIIFIHMSWGGAWAFDLYMKFFAEAQYN
ncbi:hypothetical protein HQ403_01140, partial [Candidatus Kaiserbacteria bacterium]|nr:hypothetical protein [Candidatus Kaiserbacteria bacterium]